MNNPDHTDYLEKTLSDLVKRHGAARVQADLAALLPRARWQDWQRLVNLTNLILTKQQKGTNTR
jgi:hypothetical protein